jgi:hypothetical protein
MCPVLCGDNRFYLAEGEWDQMGNDKGRPLKTAPGNLEIEDVNCEFCAVSCAVCCSRNASDGEYPQPLAIPEHSLSAARESAPPPGIAAISPRSRRLENRRKKSNERLLAYGRMPRAARIRRRIKLSAAVPGTEDRATFRNPASRDLAPVS